MQGEIKKYIYIHIYIKIILNLLEIKFAPLQTLSSKRKSEALVKAALC